jgi:Zn-dependent protease with chaperone function
MVHDDEAESASNAYLLSLVLLMVGAPIPILNLLASVIFYFGARRSSPFVRWHCTQALLGQLVLIPVNSTFVWMTLATLLGHRQLDDFYIGWGIFMAVLNVAEWGGSVHAAIKVRRGHDVRWWGLASMVDAMLGRRSWRESVVAPVVVVLAGFGAIAALASVPWTATLRVERIQGRLDDKLEELIGKSLRDGDREILEPAPRATLLAIVERICKANKLDCAGYRTHLLRDLTVNAAALPGGHVVVDAGLVFASPDAQALAGVVAHELAHAHHGHVRQTMMREIGLSMLMGAGSGQASAVFQRLVSLSYDRNMEAQADRTAVDWLIEAGVDPAPFGNFLASLPDGGTTPLVALARSHPGSEQRALEILDRIPRDHRAWEPVLSAQQWQDFTDSVARSVTRRN